MKTSAQPSGKSADAYRLFSVPLDLDNKNPATVLEDDLGKYNDSRWRFSELLANQAYGEFPSISLLTPGKAFWLLVKEAGKVIDTGAGKSNRTNKPYAIALHAQWNFIGNPFNFAIPVSNLRLQRNNKMPVLLSYNGAWSNPLTEKISELRPFEGYALYHDSPATDTLLVDPNLSASVAFTGETVKPLWSMVIHAQCQQAIDENMIAVVSNASYAWDELDYPEPPTVGESVSLYFPHPEWNKLATNYCIDARPASGHGDVWNVAVKTGAREKVELTFNGVEQVPQEFEVWLIDEVLNVSQNLRKENTYAFSGTSNQLKLLKIVVGNQNFVGEKLRAAELLPTTFELSQNFPNPISASGPFGNPTTTIRYGLPQAGKVTLKIYNVLGEEVIELIGNEQKAAGYHVFIWDGRDQYGRQAASISCNCKRAV